MELPSLRSGRLLREGLPFQLLWLLLMFSPTFAVNGFESAILPFVFLLFPLFVSLFLNFYALLIHWVLTTVSLSPPTSQLLLTSPPHPTDQLLLFFKVRDTFPAICRSPTRTPRYTAIMYKQRTRLRSMQGLRVLLQCLRGPVSPAWLILWQIQDRTKHDWQTKSQ